MPALSTSPRKLPPPFTPQPTFVVESAPARAKAVARGTARARAAAFKHLLQRNGISFDRLRALVEVHEHGSLIKAAGGNDTRASQYSRQIRELESFFEFKISERDGRALTLNRQGIELAQFAVEFFRRLEDFTQRGRGEARAFTIAAGESLLQWIVVPGLGALERVLPQTVFRLCNLQNSEIALGLEDMTFDFGLLRRESMRKPLQGVMLGSVEYCLCVPPPLLAGLDRDNLRGLLEELPLAVHLETSYIEAELEAATRGLGLRLNIRLRCDTFPNAMAALRTGRYATLMIRFPGLNPLPAGVESIPLPFLDHTHRDIYLSWNPRLIGMRPEAESLIKPLAVHFAWRGQAQRPGRSLFGAASNLG